MQRTIELKSDSAEYVQSKWKKIDAELWDYMHKIEKKTGKGKEKKTEEFSVPNGVHRCRRGRKNFSVTTTIALGLIKSVLFDVVYLIRTNVFSLEKCVGSFLYY